MQELKSKKIYSFIYVRVYGKWISKANFNQVEELPWLTLYKKTYKDSY